MASVSVDVRANLKQLLAGFRSGRAEASRFLKDVEKQFKRPLTTEQTTQRTERLKTSLKGLQEQSKSFSQTIKTLQRDVTGIDFSKPTRQNQTFFKNLDRTRQEVDRFKTAIRQASASINQQSFGGTRKEFAEFNRDLRGVKDSATNYQTSVQKIIDATRKMREAQEKARAATQQTSAAVRRASGQQGVSAKGVTAPRVSPKITADLNKALKASRDLRGEINKLNISLAALDRAAAKAGDNGLSKLINRAMESQKALSASRMAAREFTNIMKGVNMEANRFKGLKPINVRVNKASSTEIDKLNRKIVALEKRLESLGKRGGRGGKPLNKYQETLREMADSAALVTGPLGGVASRISILARITSPAALGVVGLSTAIAGLGLVLTAGVRQAAEFETSFKRTEAVIRATGGAAGFTSQQIRDLSSEIALNTLASIDGVERAAQKLLTFRSVSGETFEEALKLSQDLAELGFGSIESAATSLGKALEDPEQGLTALRRTGVTFSATQKEMVRNFLEQGKQAEAMGVILEGVKNQVEGVGEAVARASAAGAWDTLLQRTQELLSTIGEQSGALQLFKDSVNSLANAIDATNTRLKPSTETQFEQAHIQLAQVNQELAEMKMQLATMPAVSLGNMEKVIAELERERGVLGGRILALSRIMETERQAAMEAKKRGEEQQAEIARERKLADALEKARQERERLANLRRSTMRGINEEITAVAAINLEYVRNAKTLREVQQRQEMYQIVVKNGFKIGSQEAEQLTTLIERRNRLNNALEDEIAFRSQLEGIQGTIEGARMDLLEQQALGGFLDKNTTEYRGMAAAVEAYRFEQEQVLATIRQQGDITDEQRAKIRALSDEYGKLIFDQSELAAAQDMQREAHEKYLEKQKEFQETVAEGLTNLIFGAGDFEDALKSMILQMAQAIVQAQILNNLQGMMGTGGGIGGTASPYITTGGVGGVLDFLGVGDAIQRAVGGSGINAAADVVAAGLFHKGGIVGIGGEAITAPVSTFVNAPRFHNGLKPDEFPAILQKGEEVVPKDRVGKDMPSGEAPVIMNVYAEDPNAFRASERQMSRRLRGKVSRS